MTTESSPESLVRVRPRRGADQGSVLCKLGGQQCCVHKPAFPDELSGDLVLRAEIEWLLSGPPSVLERLAAALPGVCEQIGNQLLINFGNSVGFVDTPDLGQWRVVSGKWGPEDFDWMLKDLTEVASALPFAASSATALPYDRAVAAQYDFLYHAFVYLRYILTRRDGGPDDLESALRTVLREPHQRFERYRRHTSVELAGRVAERTLVKLATGAEPLVSAGQAASVPLAKKLRSRLPERVEEVRVRPTHDTAENRFVKAFLSSCTGVVDGMREHVRSEAVSALFRSSILRDCEAMDRALAPVSRDPFWSEVGPMVHFPAGSTVLQRRRGYREVLRHFARMRMAARVPLDPETVSDLLENRDIALLYELWCFFAMVRTLAKLLGSPTAADRLLPSKTELHVRRGFVVTWGSGVRLYYNRTFSRSGPGAHSYSVPLRPDVALEVPSTGSTPALHLFDAKFRLAADSHTGPDPLEVLMPKDAGGGELETEDSAERRGTFNRGDLYKMHAYRDAIAGARSVRILYPGDTSRFFPIDGKPVDALAGMALPALEGVGAIPLKPGDTASEDLRAVVTALVEAPKP